MQVSCRRIHGVPENNHSDKNKQIAETDINMVDFSIDNIVVTIGGHDLPFLDIQSMENIF